MDRAIGALVLALEDEHLTIIERRMIEKVIGALRRIELLRISRIRHALDVRGVQ